MMIVWPLLLALGQAEPDLLLGDGHHLAAVKAAPTGSQPALAKLRRDAEAAVVAPLVTVLDKTVTPPSGDKHDYYSMGPYWWPDPAQPDGLPYIRRDGEVNPETRRGTDSAALAETCRNIGTLALAAWLFDEPRYGLRAAVLLRGWFVDPATAMNPNLNYGQAIPGRTEGRGIGIIDTVSLLPVLDALTLLAGTQALDADLETGVRNWLARYLKWLLESRNGREEAATRNNHRTWYEVQVTALALATGQVDLARDRLKAALPLLADQITPDGGQPEELARTKSLSYSIFNARAWMALAALGRRTGVDVAGWRSADGRCLRSALAYLAPFYAEPDSWPHQQISRQDKASADLGELLLQAQMLWPEPLWAEMLAQAKQPAARYQLLWPGGGG